MNLTASQSDALRAELLCLADSNWVLGHWYTNCMLNGRELTDFTSMAGIAEDKLGHTRALFRFMEEYFDLPEYQLEFARDAQQVHSMELLDPPPRDWADFVLTLYLADAAIWRLSDTLRSGGLKPVARLLTRFGEEAYFHQLCIEGWHKALDDGERDRFQEALPDRLQSALRWFQGDINDELADAGIRTVDAADARARFLENARPKLESVIDISPAQWKAWTEQPPLRSWDARRRRAVDSAMPPKLWESIVPTSEAASIARRPLAVSVDDNIDLFTKTKKDETEPTF